MNLDKAISPRTAARAAAGAGLATALVSTLVVTAPTAVSAAATPGTAAVSTTADVATVSATRVLRLRAGLTLRLPDTWKVYGKGDRIQVVTGACARPGAGWGVPGCDGFLVLGPAAIKTGNELFRPYTAERPYYPATDVQLCPRDRRWTIRLGAAGVRGLRQVGAGHRAHYREWKATCVPMTGGTVKARFVQREWFLPRSKVLVVDQWNTPGLAGVLRRATWR
ncbi:hypothetical protein ACLQ2R_06155 [Streptosporangium sp. DT93]|uniref:hypothetical protein n=1 Tax=Streptosporangium sp. DT93 TaxID=3393428 RepID=UPI003CFA89CA